MKNTERVATTPDRIREAMRDAGLKQIDLARETGLSHSTVSRYLSGAVEPRQDAAFKMARVLGVTEMWLWGYDVPKQRTPEQRRNDDLVLIVAKMRKDPEFFEVVSLLAELPESEYASIKHLVSALGKK
jgi:transcriptional regulator with XRE-family HTH domain